MSCGAGAPARVFPGRDVASYASTGKRKGRLGGRPFFYFAYGAAVSEVLVDTLTGEWKLLRADVLHYVGQSINPGVAEGFAMFAQRLLDDDFSVADVKRMAVTNPESMVENG